MTTPVYPSSSDVLSGMATLAAHYNTLRADALRLGAAAADAVTLGQALARYSQWVRLEYLAANRVRVPYSAQRPPALCVDGYLLAPTAHVDLPAPPSGPAGRYYVFAVRTPGSTAFSLSASLDSADPDGARRIGELYWDGAAIDQGSIKSEELERPGYTLLGPDAEKSSAPQPGDVYIAADTGRLYVCYVEGTWGSPSTNMTPPAGIGVAAPQGILHGHGGAGGFMFWEHPAVDGTAQTVLPDGAGDALHGILYEALCRHSGGAVGTGSGSLLSLGANANIWTDGTNTLRIALNANGSVSVQRAAGSGTLKVLLKLLWI